ncbi:hypothetical protein C0389_04940 [bacterium]|nr:hypothetical protein [bacterium]
MNSGIRGAITKIKIPIPKKKDPVIALVGKKIDIINECETAAINNVINHNRQNYNCSNPRRKKFNSSVLVS